MAPNTRGAPGGSLPDEEVVGSNPATPDRKFQVKGWFSILRGPAFDRLTLI
jgi:hypothetical protein